MIEFNDLRNRMRGFGRIIFYGYQKITKSMLKFKVNMEIHIFLTFPSFFIFFKL